MTAVWSDGVIWPIAACGLATGLAMVWALLQLRPRAVAALSREVAGASIEPGPNDWWSRLAATDESGAPRLPDLPPATDLPPAGEAAQLARADLPSAAAAVATESYAPGGQ